MSDVPVPSDPWSFLAYVAALVLGGGGLKAWQAIRSRDDRYSSLEAMFRKELREALAKRDERIAALEEAVGMWQDRYWELKADYHKILAENEMLRVEIAAMKLRLEEDEAMIGGRRSTDRHGDES